MGNTYSKIHLQFIFAVKNIRKNMFCPSQDNLIVNGFPEFGWNDFK
jgi:hypothetical protein